MHVAHQAAVRVVQDMAMEHPHAGSLVEYHDKADRTVDRHVEQRPKVYTPHPAMSPDDIRRGTQGAWDRFYSFRNIWERARCVESLKSRLAFVLISKLYRQMYANTGIATDSARVGRSARWARWIAKPCRRLFTARPMPELTVPV
jgi:hypothetical protein